MNSLPPDPYKALGISKDAQVPEIRSAHRKLVLKCHPDKVQDPTLKAQKQDEFQRVQQAYELLIDENERQRYDDQVRVMEMRKEMHKSMPANSSAPRTPPRYYDVRNVEPRSDTYKTSQPSAKVYSQYPPPRSWDSDLHTTSARVVEEVVGRSARRTASYEKTYEKPSRRDEEREREKERERRRRREKEREEEAERLARAADKEAKREEKRRKEKEREKERRVASEEKRSRHKSPYVESYPEEEVYYSPKSDKKKTPSGRSKHEEKREKSTSRDAVHAQKTGEDLAAAIAYLNSSRQRKGPTSSKAFDAPMAAPTPPPAGTGPFPIAVEEEDAPRRSSAKPSSRRPSYDSPRSKEKVSHKKSGSREHIDEPIVVDAAPSPRNPPSFQKYASTPPAVPASPPRVGISRSSTMHEPGYSRPIPQPLQSQGRAATFNTTSDLNPRGRSRSRLVPQAVSEEDDSEDERRHRDARKHRSSRHKTHSPEPSTNYIDIPTRQPVTRHYAVSTSDHPHTVRIPGYGQSPEKIHSKSGSSHHARVMEARPGMPARDSGYSSSGSHYFPRVKTTRLFSEHDVTYSAIPHTRHQEEAYGAAWG
jgi:curved DNA-binding protein CbpA